MGGTLVIGSDYHREEAMDATERALNDIYSDSGPFVFLLNGDRTAAPPGPNILRNVKKQAVAAGLDHVAAEMKFWTDEGYRPFLSCQWDEGTYYQGLNINQQLGKWASKYFSKKSFTDTTGNDHDRTNRADLAVMIRMIEDGRTGLTLEDIASVQNAHDLSGLINRFKAQSGYGESTRRLLSDHVESYGFIDTLKDIRFQVHGNALHALIPYIENKKRPVLDSYESKLDEKLQELAASGQRIDYVAIFSHTNPHPIWRPEKQNQEGQEESGAPKNFYVRVYEVIERHLPDLIKGQRLINFNAHSHYQPAAYFWDRALLVATGWEDMAQDLPKGLTDVKMYYPEERKEIQRMAAMDPSRPLEYRIIDVPLPAAIVPPLLSNPPNHQIKI